MHECMKIRSVKIGGQLYEETTLRLFIHQDNKNRIR